MNFDFSIIKKLWDVAHEKLINIKGRHGILDIFMNVSHTLEMAICVVNQLLLGTVCYYLENLLQGSGTEQIVSTKEEFYYYIYTINKTCD